MKQDKQRYENNLKWEWHPSGLMANVGGYLRLVAIRDPWIGCINLYLEYRYITIVSGVYKSMAEVNLMAPSFLRRNLSSVLAELEKDMKAMKSGAKRLCPRKIGR